MHGAWDPVGMICSLGLSRFTFQLEPLMMVKIVGNSARVVFPVRPVSLFLLPLRCSSGLPYFTEEFFVFSPGTDFIRR